MYLNCKTYFSYRYGTYSTEELVSQAAEGVRSLALTNINGTPDAWDFVKFCRKAGIKPIIGAEIRNNHQFCYILLAKNENGLQELNRFLSQHKRDKTPFPERPDLDEIYIIYALGTYPPEELEENELIGIKPSEVNKLFSIQPEKHPDKFVIRQPVTFQNARYYSLHRLLRAIDLNTLYTKLEPQDLAGADETFIPETEII